MKYNLHFASIFNEGNAVVAEINFFMRIFLTCLPMHALRLTTALPRANFAMLHGNRLRLPAIHRPRYNRKVFSLTCRFFSAASGEKDKLSGSESLPPERLSKRQRIKKLSFVLLGIITMALTLLCTQRC